MYNLKLTKTLFLSLFGLLTSTACSNLTFSEVISSCEAPNSSAKFGMSGPLILYPTADSVVGGKVTVKGSCITGVPVDIHEASGVDSQAACAMGMFSKEITLSDGEGVKDLVVSQNTGTNGDAVVDRLCFTKDTVPPAVTIGGTGGNGAQSTSSVNTTINGTCESGLSVILSGPGLAAPVTTDCNGGNFSVSVTLVTGDGTKGIIGTQIDRAGNQGTANGSLNIDTAPPIVKITSTIPVVTRLSTLAISGICETGIPVEIGEFRSNIAPAAACVAGVFSTTVPLIGADGPVNVRVYQVDNAGNIGFDTKNLLKDTTPPAVTITSPLASAFLSPTQTFTGACETGLPVALSGSVLNAAQSVACTSGQWTVSAAISAGQGAKELIAVQTDAAGNVGQTQRTFSVDTTAPILAITSPAANSYVGASFTLTGTCETGLLVQIAGAGVVPATSTACNAGAFSVGVSVSPLDGSKVVTATQTDAAGNTGSTSRTFLRDTVAPVLSITSPAANSYISATINLTGACEAGLSVELSGAGLAAVSQVTCAANGTYAASLAVSSGDGTKVINAKETDAAGNQSTASSSYLRDTTPPAIAITSPAANTVAASGLTVGGTCETGLNVTLSGAGVSAPVITACNNAAFSAAVVFTAGGGNKVVSASQTDAAGNVGTDSRTFVSNLTPPTITITSPNANAYVTLNFVVQGACEIGSNVILGGAGLAAEVTTTCPAGTYSGNVVASSGDGSKVVTAKQTNSVGLTATATRTFLRDTVAPILTITSPANGTTAQNGITLVGTCETGLTVNFSGAGINAASPVTCVSGTYQSALTFSAGDGAKVVTVSETDDAGNNSQVTGTFNRDTTPPAVAITSPDANTVGSTGLTISGVCEAGLNVILNGAGVASSTTVLCSTVGTFSSAITFSAGSGSKTVTATQTDAMGNVGSNSRVFISDLNPPTITITSPAANSYVGANFVVQGACETGLNVTLNGAGLAAAVTASCTAGAYSANVVTSAGDGTKTVNAQQTDSVGNTASASKNYLRDTLAPTLTITSPSNGTSAQSGITLVGTCESGLSISFSGSGITSATPVICTTGGTYQSNLTFSAGDGSKTVTVSETDAAGNNSQTTGTFNRDTTAPVVAITSPDANTSAQNGLTISGTCESGLNVVIAGAGVASSSTVACTSGVFSSAITFSAGSGGKTVTATQTDAVGNVGSDSRSFVRDLVAPVVSITSPAANSYLGATFVLQGACETGLNVVISGTGISSGGSVPCAAGAYATTLTTSSGDGTKTVSVQQTDAAGNVGQASQNFLRDATAPALTITSPAANSSVLPTANLIGTCETGLTVSVTGDITSTSGSCVSGAFNISITFTTALGTKSVTVKQTDAAGNVGQASSQFLRDSDASTETFISDASFGKIDILFIDDNSASMDPKQASLGTKFSGFATELLNIDWQIGITTTDCSTGPYGICGSLLSLTGANSTILKPSTANYQTVFNNSIQRPETAGCLNTGTCPSGNSEPLLSATTAMTKNNTVNNGFFRANSDLAIVILSDADERQTGGATYANRPADLVSTFNSIWPSGKKLKVYSIIVKPGDSTCLSTMQAGSGGFSFYGSLVDQTVNLTSGLSTSICAPDYSVTLKSIGESVRTLTNSVALAHTPLAGSVTVQFTPNQSITYKVIDNKVVFDSPPSVGTEIKVSYRY